MWFTIEWKVSLIFYSQVGNRSARGSVLLVFCESDRWHWRSVLGRVTAAGRWVVVTSQSAVRKWCRSAQSQVRRAAAWRALPRFFVPFLTYLRQSRRPSSFRCVFLSLSTRRHGFFSGLQLQLAEENIDWLWRKATARNRRTQTTVSRL